MAAQSAGKEKGKPQRTLEAAVSPQADNRGLCSINQLNPRRPAQLGLLGAAQALCLSVIYALVKERFAFSRGEKG